MFEVNREQDHDMCGDPSLAGATKGVIEEGEGTTCRRDAPRCSSMMVLVTKYARSMELRHIAEP